MITLAASDTLAGVADVASKVTITISGMEEGRDYTISGSGFPGTAVRVGVSYQHRSEVDIAMVADGSDGVYEAGDISVTLHAEEAGPVSITVWDDAQRNVLATAEVTCG